MNEQLLKPYIREEVFVALKNMHLTKAPGPDGMSALFYQLYYYIVGNDVTNIVLNILNNGACPKKLNKTFIALIPKVRSPRSTMGCRPISLCNVTYKMVSKVITNRLKEILHAIVHECQSTIVSKRLIIDNVLIAFKHFHYMVKKRKGKRGFMALKLDMSKAYDIIEWEFLRHMLLKLGFDEEWVNLCMRCVTTVSYVALVNRRPTEWFEPDKGL